MGACRSARLCAREEVHVVKYVVTQLAHKRSYSMASLSYLPRNELNIDPTREDKSVVNALIRLAIPFNRCLLFVEMEMICDCFSEEEIFNFC